VQFLPVRSPDCHSRGSRPPPAGLVRTSDESYCFTGPADLLSERRR
jgi:hypothetical protein